MTARHRVWRHLVSSISALLALTLGPHCLGKTHTFPEHGIAIQIPDDWVIAPEIAASVQPPAHLIVAVVNPERNKSFTALAVDVRTNGSFSHQDFIRGMQQPMKERGWILSASAPLVIDGVTFDSFSATEPDTATPLLQTASTLANARAYTLSISSRAANPLEDRDLQSILKSFRFLTPPTSVQQASTAYRLGYMVGLVTLALGGLAILYAIIAWLVRSRARRP